KIIERRAPLIVKLARLQQDKAERVARSNLKRHARKINILRRTVFGADKVKFGLRVFVKKRTCIGRVAAIRNVIADKYSFKRTHTAAQGRPPNHNMRDQQERNDDERDTGDKK